MIDQIAELWQAGRTQSEIAREIAATPSTVSGLIARARARGDNRFEARPPALRPKPKTARWSRAVGSRTAKSRPAGRVMAETAPKPQRASPEPVPFALLWYGQCKWPTNDAPPGRIDLLLFCGKAIVPGVPYCESHARIARPSEASGRARSVK
jgi:hypothetical protein